MAVVAADPFSDRQLGLKDPARNSFAITPSDTDQLATVTRWLYVGVSGDVTVLLDGDGASVVLKAMPVGLYPLCVRQVKATGTAATNLIGLY
jgi:hypothetical protein